MLSGASNTKSKFPFEITIFSISDPEVSYLIVPFTSGIILFVELSIGLTIN